MVGSGDGGNGEGGGVPHVVILYSGKLCSVDKPTALNKPVAAPGGGALSADSRRRGGWTEKVVKQDDATDRCSCLGLIFTILNICVILGSTTCSLVHIVLPCMRLFADDSALFFENRKTNSQNLIRL